MSPRIAAKALVACVALAFPAAADQGLGPAPGNALNPAPIVPSTAGRAFEAEGMGTRSPAARSPTGKLFEVPLDPGEEVEGKPQGWQSSGFVELGGLGIRGDDRAWGFRNYKDIKDGLYLNSFGLAVERPDQARYIEATGGAVGMDDQFYRLVFGRYNDWKVTAWFDGTPHVFTTSYRSLWNGIGTGNLDLVALRPGGTTSAPVTQANIQAAVAATPYSELGLVREKAGVRIDKVLGEHWKAFASLTDEKRKGARPFGAVFGGGGGGGNVEVAESIDYDTSDFLAGLQFSDATTSFNLRAAASFFRNDIATMTFQNPLYITLNGTTGMLPTSFTQGRFEQPPDNEHFNVKAEYSRALPDFFRSTFTAVAAIGSMRQDDRLIAPTTLPLTGGTVTAGGVSLANQWNTPAALSQDSAGARLDTRLIDLGFASKPSSGLDVRAKLRYYETRNETEYLACNPLTGQWGRLLNDGSGLSLVSAATSPNAYNAAGCNLAGVLAMNLAPAAGNIPVGSIPFDYRQVVASLSADHRLGKSSTLNAAIERESFDRDFRERDRTWEDKVKLGYVDRGAIDGTIRLSYEFARRGGSDYNPNPYEAFLSASFGPVPVASGTAVQSWLHNLQQLRSYDLADRTQNTLNGRIDYAVGPATDAALTLRLKDADYAAEYGRTGHQRNNSFSLDLSHQAGPGAMVYGFYSMQLGSMAQKGVQPNACQINFTYYHYSDGRVLSAATGAAAPATPSGTTLVATQGVTAGNWFSVCGAASPTSPLFPESRGWDVTSKDRNTTVGMGIKYDFSKARLDASFTRSLGRTRISYGYNAVALGMTPAQAALAGESLSDLSFAQTVLDASLVIPVQRNVSLRLLVRHESGRIRDWHYDDLAANPAPTNNSAFLDAGPQDYRTTVFGLLIQVRM